MKQLEILIAKLIGSKVWLHTIFCLVFIFLFFIPVLLNERRSEIVQSAIVSCLFILSCTYAGRWCGKLWLAKRRISSCLIGLLIFSLLFSVVGAAGAAYLFKRNIAEYFLPFLPESFSLVVLFMLFGLFIAMVRNTIFRKVNEARLMQEQRESELKLLLSQLSPHFLFNTLNNIYGISITEHHRVPQLLLKLSELLRYSVYETRQRFISLHDELIYINNYIDFERIHIGDKLILLMDINNIEDNHIKIAPMLLIVFVENAFKHSKNSLAENIYIEISLQVRADWIHFAVKNSYRAAEKEDYRLNEPYGIGLHHTLKRLDLIYGQNYRYDTKKENGVYSIGLKLKVS